MALAPLHIATVAGEMAAPGSVFTFTWRDAEAVQPLASVTVTENDVVAVGFTEMLAVVDPVFHE